VQATMNGERKCVLIIEDDPLVAWLVAELLKSHGIAFITAACAEAARTTFAAQHNSISTIISDLSLPGADGVTLVRQLVQDRPDIGIIFATGHLRNEQDLSNAIGRPVSLLLKPFSPKEFKAALDKHIQPQTQAHSSCTPKTLANQFS
jgi:two-component system cell cycle sensor histidine kinase/response regulator CckA